MISKCISEGTISLFTLFFYIHNYLGETNAAAELLDSYGKKCQRVS